MTDNELLSPADIERQAGECGLSIPALCKAAGIAHTTFGRWKAGKTEPTLDVYRRLRDALRSAREVA